MEFYLKWPDYLILVSFLAISLAIGVYHSLTGGRQKTTSEFILADRRLAVLPTAISLLVSFQSAVNLLGLTAEMYCYGTQYLVYGLISTSLSVLITERFIVPWIYPLKLVSVYEYFERRYRSKSIRIFGSSLGIVAAVLVMGAAMYAPSAALESATGLPLTFSIPVMAIVAVAYTALGGMRAVIWTDVFQFLIMIGGIAAIFIKGLIMVGGISNVFSLAAQEGRLILADLNPDPRVRHTVWGLLIGVTIHWVNGYGLSQAAVQRYSAVDRLSHARLTMLLNMPPVFLMIASYCIVGLVVLAYYSTVKCDPLANKDISNPNQLLPYFVVTIFADSPGFGGLFLATLYGGALSTVSSYLSGSAANIWEDILNWKLDRLPESKKALINRLLVIVLGVLSTAMAFLASAVPGPITQVLAAMCGSVMGPLLALFLMGGITRFVNWKGCLCGGILGLVFTLWLAIGSLSVRNYPPLQPVSTERCYSQNSSLISASPDNLSLSNDDAEWNYTLNGLPPFNEGHIHHTDEYEGLENFYAISYTWFTVLSLIFTSTVIAIASLIMRDKELEQKIDDSLLLRFTNCGCREEKSQGNIELNKTSSEVVDSKVVKRVRSCAPTETTNGIL